MPRTLRRFGFVLASLLVLRCSQAHAQLTLVEEGGEFAENNLALLPDAVAFAPDALAGFEDIHNVPHLNDGVYGNSNSWIGETGLFAGVYLGGEVFTITSVAFGRDNLGQFADRSTGTYVLQYSEEDPADELTPDDEWTTIGEWTYGEGNLCPGRPALRHRINFEPVEATAIRVLVPFTGIAQGTAIDEIEIYSEPGEDLEPCVFLCELVQVELPVLERGGPGAEPPGADSVPGLDDGNLARAADAVAFGTPPHPAPVHEIAHLNDGLYGNAQSWLGNEPGATSGETYAGIYFTDGARLLDQIALGRDNLAEFTDRAAGCYVVQVTTAEFDYTDDAAVAAVAWETIGKGVDHLAGDDPSLRRRYQLPREIDARAVRVITEVQNAIDEIELYLALGEPEPGDPLEDPVEVGGCMDESLNLSLREGATAFALDSLAGYENIHNTPLVRDGIYGNSNSWIGNSGNPGFIGIHLGELLTVSSIAFGRDNGGEAQEFTDRNQGTYIIQYSTDAEAGALTPNERWETIGHLNYDGFFPFDGLPHLRHRYNFDPVEATAIRIVVPGVGLGEGTCIDEIELYAEEGEEIDEIQDPCYRIEPCNAVDGAEELEPVVVGGPVVTPAFPEEVPGADVGNLALAGGAIPFGTPPHPAPVHEIAHLNDGLYGNSQSWLGNENGPASGIVYAGIFFADGARTVGEIALGRDNTAALSDRALGCHVLQYSADDIDYTDDAAVAAAEWRTIGVLGDHRNPADAPLRRLYEFPQVEARAIRVVTQVQNAIDEIELYEGEIPPVSEAGAFRRGDADGNGVLDITDAISNLSYQFLGEFQPTCLDALDWDDNSTIDLTDPIASLTRQFLGGAPAAPPGSEECGEDPTADDLGPCEQAACQ